jgi:hypothetical protein
MPYPNQNALRYTWGALCKVRVSQITKGNSTRAFMYCPKNSKLDA